MTYFITITNINPGNSLQRKLQGMADKIDHRTNSDPAQFLRDLNEQVVILNKQYPRCTPVRVTSSLRYSLVEDSDLGFYLSSGNWYLHICFQAIKGKAEL